MQSPVGFSTAQAAVLTPFGLDAATPPNRTTLPLVGSFIFRLMDDFFNVPQNKGVVTITQNENGGYTLFPVAVGSQKVQVSYPGLPQVRFQVDVTAAPSGGPGASVAFDFDVSIVPLP